MKQGWMAITATTMEALMGCIRDDCLVISVEPPLLHSIRNQLEQMPELRDYDVMWYDRFEIALLKKVRGSHRFDDTRFNVYHYLLSDETH